MTAGPPFRDDLLSTLEVPLVAAPMAGGPSSPELVAAVSRAGGLGMLAGGYQAADALHEQIQQVRRALAADDPRSETLPAETSPDGTPTGKTPPDGTLRVEIDGAGHAEAGRPFGVNLFTPESCPTDPEALATFRRRWVATVRELDDELGRAAAEQPLPVRTDDGWSEKIRLLLEDPVPLVSFTFGLPPERTVRDLQERGTVVVVSVASLEEALRAARLGPDALVVQGPEAGGHRATLSQDVAPGRTPLADLLPEVVSALGRVSATGRGLPVIAAGGIGTREQAASLLGAGAVAVQVGTLFVVAQEAGTSAAHRQALLEAAASGQIRTVVTRAFSGRPARALATAYTAAMAPHQIAGYPEVNSLASPVRRAAAAAGRTELVHLWAGTGAAACRERPAAGIVDLFRGL